MGAMKFLRDLFNRLRRDPAPTGPVMKVTSDGDKMWLTKAGFLHREDGPAVEYVDGIKEWYRNGQQLTAEEITAIQERTKSQPSPNSHSVQQKENRPMATINQGFNNAAEEYTSHTKSINCGANAAVFAGRIVAYATNIYLYGNPDDHWQKPGNPVCYFGYVEKDAKPWGNCYDRGPNMPSVLKPDAVDGTRALVKDILDKPSRAGLDKLAVAGGQEPFLHMRLANPDEIAAIRQAIASSHAKVDYNNTAFMQALDRDAPQPRAPSSSGFKPA